MSDYSPAPLWKHIYAKLERNAAKIYGPEGYAVSQPADIDGPSRNDIVDPSGDSVAIPKSKRREYYGPGEKDVVNPSGNDTLVRSPLYPREQTDPYKIKIKPRVPGVPDPDHKPSLSEIEYASSQRRTDPLNVGNIVTGNPGDIKTVNVSPDDVNDYNDTHIYYMVEVMFKDDGSPEPTGKVTRIDEAATGYDTVEVPIVGNVREVILRWYSENMVKT